ncbi:MAG TPA: ubiquinol-cytochrome C chaperone family protein [Acetobacteraceae bacterium]|nr:ubiquinol-cytochrome C chaperone family protein [Acetobacteraceae bacterium]
MGLLALFRRRPLERPGFLLYTAAVTAARDPRFFGEAVGVPDTLDGRFDLVGLHTAVLIRRLHRDPDPRGAEAAQAVFDAMFADMDVNLREMGVGDMSVGKRVKRMWEAFHGRAQAYEAALDAGDRTALEAALARNVWRADTDQPPPAGAAALATQAERIAAALATQPLAALLRGEVVFPPAPGGATSSDAA